MFHLGEKVRCIMSPRAISLLCIGLALSSWLMSCASQPQIERQTMVHQMGSNVMPFDLAKTQHVFEMTERGGIQQVVTRGANSGDQVPLIRKHLKQEAMRLSEGDFSDPRSLHGQDMPGVKELSEGASMIRIDYSELPNGAQITFETDDVRLITAIHRWFGAQLSDHGADAASK